ncbi:MAG: hypothetical protein J0L60_06750 [Ignavibacteria bacterium]|nr:hypothetical protein [Ignavibacteria bacterium]
MTYDELMSEIVGAKPKFEEPEELMKLIRRLIEQNEELQKRVKNLQEWNRYYKQANVKLMEENHNLKWSSQ